MRRLRFKFLSMFDLQDRKDMDLLLKAYLAEFKADEDVCLVLKITQHTHRTADPAALLAHFVEKEAGLRLEKTPPIILVQGFIPRAELPRLYASADAFVLPTRGEGFGLPYIEALACGLSVIATRWSSQLDFLHDGNSYLIDIEGLVPASWRDVEYFAGHRWAQPSVEHLRQLMRTVYSSREEARRRAENGRQEIVERWDWSVVVKQWVAEFRRLLDT
jgi:glycosyltransferase involved in cell wall biosynthesis